MVPYRSREALRNLKRGAKKMEDVMSPAARVRRSFRLGRPPKDTLPLHPKVAWEKAESLLADFRQRMTAAGLKPDDVDGQIIGIRGDRPDEPDYIPAEKEKALATLWSPDVIALGMVFRQLDRATGQDIFFPVQFTGLNENGIMVLRRAAEKLQAAGGKMSSAN